MSDQTVDYDALAKQHGAAVDYDALAKQHGAADTAAPSSLERWKAEGVKDRLTDFTGAVAATDDAAQRALRGAGLPGNLDEVGPWAKRVFLPTIGRPAPTTVGGMANDAAASIPVLGPMAEGAAQIINDKSRPVGDRIAAAVPVLGPAAVSVNDSLKRGDYAGAAGGMASVAGMAAGPEIARAAPKMASAVSDTTAMVKSAPRAIVGKVLPSLVDGPPEEMITRAVKPGKNNVGWDNTVSSALPQLKASEAELGKPIENIDDALQAATIAKKRIWAQYEQRLGPAAKMGAAIDGNEIADAMEQSLSERQKTQNPSLASKVQAVADTYRRPMTLDQAEDFLQDVNNELHSYYAKNKVGRQAALADPEKAFTVAEGDALRSALYSKLDELSGPGAADLKKQYGAVDNLQGEMAGRKLVSDRQQPQSLSEQLSTARGYGKVAKGIFTLSPGDVVEGAQSIATSKYLKERNSTDAMIQRAFAKVTPAEPPEAPQPVPIRGALPPGPQVTPPPSSFTEGATPGAPAIRIDPTTRAQRMGLMLPERTAIDLPSGMQPSRAPSVPPTYEVGGQPRKVGIPTQPFGGESQFAVPQREIPALPAADKLGNAAAKLPESASGPTMLMNLKRGGISADEITQSGLNKFMQSKIRVTRQEVLDYLARR